MNREASKSLVKGQYLSPESIFLKRGKAFQPREYMRDAVQLIRRRSRGKPLEIIDVGCATGDFLGYCFSELPVRHACGVDVSRPLINRARERFPSIEWCVDGLPSLKSIGQRRFDVCVSFGTFPIFDEIDSSLRRLWSLVKPGGFLLIFTPMNVHPVDVVVRYRPVSRFPLPPWGAGLNVFSIKTWERALSALKRRGPWTLNEFSLPVNLPKGKDPLRSWSELRRNGKRQVMVGTGQLLDFYFLILSRPFIGSANRNPANE